jgi:hypothetical protein
VTCRPPDPGGTSSIPGPSICVRSRATVTVTVTESALLSAHRGIAAIGACCDGGATGPQRSPARQVSPRLTAGQPLLRARRRTRVMRLSLRLVTTPESQTWHLGQPFQVESESTVPVTTYWHQERDRWPSGPPGRAVSAAGPVTVAAAAAQTPARAMPYALGGCCRPVNLKSSSI